MNKAEAVMIDTREPDWVQNLKFGGIPTAAVFMETGDAQIMCSDGCTVIVERKTPEDFLNSLRDDRLLPQLARMVEPRITEQINGRQMTWPYLVIQGEMRIGSGGKVITSDRGVTGWDWNSVQGALLTIQEMGVMVTMCDEAGYEACLLRLAQRDRRILKLLPPKPPQILGAGAAFLAGIPGIGAERVMDLMHWGGNQVGHILTALTDPRIELPPGIGPVTRGKVRGLLGLSDKVVMNVSVTSDDVEVLEFQKVKE